MIGALTGAILPIFAVMAIGFVLGARGAVSPDAPAGLNRFALLVAVPALLFSILARADLAALDPRGLGAYLAGEATVYAAGVLIARRVFRRAADEALLLGFAAAFVNHVLFVLPVAEGLYGDRAAAPIGAIVVVDALVTFPLTVLGMELLTGRGRGGGAVARQVLLNPMLAAPVLGLAVNLSGLALPAGLWRFVEFAGGAAAPAALFALGVTLSGADLRRFGAASVTIAALSIVAHPGLVHGLNLAAGDASAEAGLMVTLAAGPCGAMPYALASVHGTPTASIAKAIVLSTAASLVTLSLLA